jgi:hypothetical protein
MVIGGMVMTGGWACPVTNEHELCSHYRTVRFVFPLTTSGLWCLGSARRRARGIDRACHVAHRVHFCCNTEAGIACAAAVAEGLCHVPCEPRTLLKGMVPKCPDDRAAVCMEACT